MPRVPRLARAAGYWLLPSLICLWLHRDGLHAWFQADDFAWLGMNTEYADTRTFLQAVFRPAAQGTIRPWSEHLFFFAFWHWFGWNAFPYRLFVFLNQCVNLLLVTYLVRRLTQSALAGFLAPLLWMANAAVVVPMAWTSGYNEILCTTFLLAALALFMRANDRRFALYYVLQLCVFILGFGALELNIVYPALAAAYAFFYQRRLLPWTVPLFLISAAYYKLHASLVPLQTAGPYKPHFDLEMLRMLASYWQLTFVPPYGYLTVHPLVSAAFLLIASAGLAYVLLQQTRKRAPAAAFFACWFLISLAPLLPFRDHLTHYYLFVPLIGFSALSAIALARFPAAGALIAAAYLCVQMPALAAGERWYLDRSRDARSLVMGVKQIHEWEPAKAILLTNVSSELYGFTVADTPFRLIPNTTVYLAPESVKEITGLAPNLVPVTNFALPAGPARHALLAGELAVYSAAQFPLQEVTAIYTAQALAEPEPEEPRRVDAGSPVMAYLLGKEWYPLEGPYRWMAKHASLRMGGPRSAASRLSVSGFAAPESFRNGPLPFTVNVDGKPVGTATISAAEPSFHRDFGLPAETLGKPVVSVEISVARTFRAQAGARELGLVFGIFEIR